MRSFLCKPPAFSGRQAAAGRESFPSPYRQRGVVNKTILPGSQDRHSPRKGVSPQSRSNPYDYHGGMGYAHFRERPD